MLKDSKDFSTLFQPLFSEANKVTDAAFDASQILALQARATKPYKERAKELSVAVVASSIAVQVLAQLNRFSRTTLKAATLSLNMFLNDEQIDFNRICFNNVQGEYAFSDSVLFPSFKHGINIDKMRQSCKTV